MSRPNLRVTVFPDDDPALSRDVAAALAQVPEALPNDAARAALQQELRRWYRSLVIHQRDAFGAYPDDPTTVWYVYRDGRIRRHNEALERLYTAMAVARTTCEASERAVASAWSSAGSAGYETPNGPADGFRTDRHTADPRQV